MDNQKREYYRVEYPNSYFPEIELGDEKFDVQDVSECGIRFKVATKNLFNVNDRITASIRFADGEVYERTGHIVRLTDMGAVMVLNNPIPLKKIRAEHLYLISHYALK